MPEPDQEIIEEQRITLSGKDDNMTDRILHLLGEEGIQMLIPLELAERIGTVQKEGKGIYVSRVGKFPLRSYDPSVKEKSVVEIVIELV